MSDLVTETQIKFTDPCDCEDCQMNLRKVKREFKRLEGVESVKTDFPDTTIFSAGVPPVPRIDMDSFTLVVTGKILNSYNLLKKFEEITGKKAVIKGFDHRSDGGGDYQANNDGGIDYQANNDGSDPNDCGGDSPNDFGVDYQAYQHDFGVDYQAYQHSMRYGGYLGGNGSYRSQQLRRRPRRLPCSSTVYEFLQP